MNDDEKDHPDNLLHRKRHLVIAFIIKNVTDYSHYSPTFNSAPFSAWVLANALYFILPAILVLVAGIIVRKKL